MRLPALLLSLLALAVAAPTAAQAPTAAPAPPAAAQPAGAPQAGAPVRVTYLFSDGNIPGTLQALETLYEQYPDLRGRVQLELVTESTYGEVDAAAVRGSDVLVLDTMNEQMLGRFNGQHNANLIKEIAGRGGVLAVGESVSGPDAFIKQGAQSDNRARAYWTFSGPENQLSLLKLALTKAGVTGLSLSDPVASLDSGFYYPDGKTGRVFPNWEAFDAWKRANGKSRPGAPRIAIGFFKATYYSGDTALLNALVAEVERQGGEAIPLFGYPAANAFQRLLLDADGRPRADAAMGLSFQFVDSEAPKALEKVGIPVLNLISLYGRSEKDWRNSPNGLSTFEGTFNLAGPELAGTTAPTVVGAKEKRIDPATGLNTVLTSPIPSQVELAVRRTLRYAALSRKPNSDKKIAILYYNYPPGKANIGASYLNVAESLANILQRMKQEGYDIGGEAPSAEAVLEAITTRARNVGGEAPGELQELIAQGAMERIPVDDYRRWLDGMAPSLKAKILKDWGEPEDTRIMAVHENGRTDLLAPALHYGNILLTPQPARGWGEDLEKLYHAKDLAPPHQYVAAYAWLRNGYKADAVVHVGTHGTLEWLDGRDAGLAPDDAPDALIADMPNAYIYNVDVVGEGLVAKRRSSATLIDHMVPPFVEGGLTEDLAKLGELMNDHAQNETKNPELATRYGDQLRVQAIKLGIAKDLGLPPDRRWSDEELHRIEDYLLDLKGSQIPFGLHAFGRSPEPAAVDSTVKAIVAVDRSQLPDARKVLSEEMTARINDSGPRELDGLMKALGGRFVPAGMGGEPIRNPDSYATGANFYGIDPDKVPKPAAWEMGSKLAQQMLDDAVAKTGKYPEKISFVIWGDETMRHEGVMESQIFYLLGSKPVWNARGKVVGVDIIPRAELGRPRVDIVIASAAEGLFSNVTYLIDDAVQKVKALDEADNAVRKHYLSTKAALVAKGVKAEDADRMAGVRIFDEPPGIYNLNTSNIVAASGSWDSEAGFANDYIRKMGHGFGNGFRGEAMEDAFRLALSGVEKVVHSSSTMLYGTLDNDDMYMYMGGLAAAVRSIDGKTPETLITNTRDPGRPAMTSLDRFIGQEFRSRYVNPTWIKGMQKEGYAGAGEMKAFIEYMWGWDATVTTAVDDAMWKETFDTYVEDKHKLGMKSWFESKSPFAYQDISARMIETIRKDYWKADQATKSKLVNEYIESVNKHGVSCSEVTCGNGRLLEYVMQEAVRAGVPAPALAQARAAIEKAIGKKIETAAQELRDFANRNDARENATRAQGQADAAAARAASAPNQARGQASATRPAPSPDAAKPPEPAKPPAKSLAQAAAQVLKGMLMQEEDRTPPRLEPPAATKPVALSMWDLLWPVVLLMGLMAGWRWRETARARA